MKIEKKKYFAPVSSFVEIESLSVFMLNASDGQIDTDGDDGGWAKEEVGGSWEDIWNAQ